MKLGVRKLYNRTNCISGWTVLCPVIANRGKRHRHIGIVRPQSINVSPCKERHDYIISVPFPEIVLFFPFKASTQNWVWSTLN